MSELIKITKNHYEPRLEKYSRGHQILDWEDKPSQEVRFGLLVENIDLHNKTILDVGCGVGDLFGYLEKLQITTNYTGVDILKKMIDKAKTVFPNGNFQCRDVISDSNLDNKKFDVIFCSGIFNLNFGNNREFLKKAINVFLNLSNESVVFNLLHNRSKNKDKKYFYYDPLEIKELFKDCCIDISIQENYLPNDFTVICTKKS